MASQASGDLPALYSIVIKPIEVTKGRYKFTCSGEYLAVDGFGFDTNVHSALPLLQPARTKKGTVKLHQPYVKQTTVEYWMAQCIFRGLAASGTKKDLQQRARDAFSTPSKGAMFQEYKLEEARLIKQFRLQNAAKRDSEWSELSSTGTIEARAEADPERFLKDTIAQAPKNHAIVVKTEHGMELHQAAERLGMA